MALSPAQCEPLLPGARTDARLAVIIDVLMRQQGLDPTTGSPATKTTTNSADMSGADAAITPAPTAGKKVIIDSVLISAGAALTVTLKEETSGTVIAGPFYLASGTSLNVPIEGTQLPTADKRLMGRTSGAGNITFVTQSHSSP